MNDETRGAPRRPGEPGAAQDQLPPPGADRSVTTEMGEQPDHGEDSYRGSDRLLDRAAVVTGGDSGIGRAVALAFAREGADVLLSYLETEEDDAQETARLVESAGRRAVLVPGDLTEERMCLEVVDRAMSDLGRIDILVNNAAYQMLQPGGIADITTEQLERVFRTNVYATFWLCKSALTHMKPGSCIINTSSVVATSPVPSLLDYSATKAAIVNFTRGLALMVADKGIRVNSVAPGPVWTPLIPATMPPDVVATFGTQTPLGRPAQPAELASAYVYLASPESSYVTGEVLAVTGGDPV